MVFRFYSELSALSGDFIFKVSSLSPTKHFIIHSRKALLNGISPAENRSIPPLKYVVVYFHFFISMYIHKYEHVSVELYIKCTFF
jgi:hypothetical protein